MSKTPDHKVLSITTEATLHMLIKRCEDSNERFFFLRDMESGLELGSIEVRTVADHNLLLANEGIGAIN